MAIVYRHSKNNNNNEVFYIGIGEDEGRAYKSNGRTKYWNNIVNKYGYIIEILITNISYDEAKIIEIGLIEYYGRRDLGTGILVNLTEGGDGSVGFKHSEETKSLLSKKGKGRIAWNKGVSPSEKTKEKISKKLIGNNNGTGYNHTEKTKEKISNSKKDKFPSKKIIEIRKNKLIDSYKKRGKHWSQKDIDIILNNYKNFSDKELHKNFFTNRTYNSVRSMRIKLKIKRR